MKGPYQSSLTALALLISSTHAWKLREYHSSGCQGLLQTEGGTQWVRCTNFDLPHDDNMARGIKYSGLTPVSSGEQWLFDLRVFSGTQCSGEEAFVSETMGDTCIPGPWKSYMINRAVPIPKTTIEMESEDNAISAEAEDGPSIEILHASNNQVPIKASSDDIPVDAEVFESSRDENLTITTIPASQNCWSGNEGGAFLRAHIQSALNRVAWCEGQNPNPCRGTVGDPYPHLYPNDGNPFESFPVKRDGTSYMGGAPGPFRVTYSIINGNRVYRSLVKHPNPHNNNLVACP